MNSHSHVARIDFDTPVVAYCDRCGVELVADVARWAADRGIIPTGTKTAAADIRARLGTIKAAIDKAANREPGLT